MTGTHGIVFVLASGLRASVRACERGACVCVQVHGCVCVPVSDEGTQAPVAPSGEGPGQSLAEWEGTLPLQ